MSNPTCYHLSASSISAFKACPTRFRLGYREGLRPVEDTESQRVGTNWHKLHEVFQNHWRETGDKDEARDAALQHLNDRYAETPCPASKTIEEWDVERQVLAVSFVGYHGYWTAQEDSIAPLVSELPFKLPVMVPGIGLPLPVSEVLRVGKVDHLVLWRGKVVPWERKSTSRSIAPDSEYWEKSRKDTQVSMYATAFRDLVANPELLSEVVQKCPEFDPNVVGSVLYDVWHKPTLRPSMLTQKETAALVATKAYCGSEFDITGDPANPESLRIEGKAPTIELGKKAGAFAIRETPDLFAARLAEDITKRPEFYFQRREITRSDQEVEKFRGELFNLYQAQKLYSQYNVWVENEAQCRATFPCPYIPICYGPGADAVCDGATTPPGFKRIFVDLTVQETDEG